MRVDISEIKEHMSCRRKWAFHSRNYLNLVSRAPNDKLKFGTQFHKALHSLYAGKRDNIDAIIDAACEGLEDPRQMRTMLTGYVTEVLMDDLASYKVLDIEHGFKIPLHEFVGVDHPLCDDNGEIIMMCGSLDMIVLETSADTIWGFEHKSCKAFRTSDTPILMDAQPRTYDIVLIEYVKKYNETHGTNYKAGGIIMNFVKKLIKEFQYKRVYCIYNDKDRLAFKCYMLEWIQSLMNDVREQNTSPTPDLMGCAMCDFITLCDHVGFCEPNLQNILDEFEEEYEVRKIDHLDEKEAEYADADY